MTRPTTSTPAVVHRPHGIEHPYATSVDQRFPVLPEAGQRVRLGVRARADVTAVVCEWQSLVGDDYYTELLSLQPADASRDDLAALSGGEGHLAEAQAAATTDHGGWSTDTSALDADVRYRYRFTATGDGGDDSTEWFEVTASTWAQGRGTLTVEGRPADDHPLVVPGSVQWFGDGMQTHRVRFSLRLRPDDHVIGFGERFDALDRRGRTLDAVVFEQYKSQAEHGRTYLPMPFAHVVSSDPEQGWGFHVRTSRRSWYDVAFAAPDELRIEVALGGDRLGSADVGIYRGTPTDVLNAFLHEVGRAEELPDWVFRLWASGNEWNTQDIVMSRMDTHRDLGLPVGVVVIEAWSDEEGITIFRDADYQVRLDGAAHQAADFRYPADGAWPDPKAMIDELHARGIKVLLWQIPLQKTAYDLGPDIGDDTQVIVDGNTMVSAGHAVREADGSAYHNRGWWFPQALMPDLSTRRTREWWTEKRRYLVKDLDVDGFKTDGGEHAWGHDLRYGDGRRGDEGNNLYPVHYARAFGDLLRSEGKAPVTFSRAGFTGSQAHGVFWAGDENSTWEAFRSSITAGLTASACGIIYWGWDLAGFSGPVPDAELYLRATAAATFMPIMQYHSEFNHHQRPLRDRTPWWVAEVNDDPSVIDVFLRYAVLREALVPYLKAQAREAIETGRPLMRALCFDYGADLAVWDHPHQYLLGSDLLVSPVIEGGATEWSTYLPAGSWVDVWTGQPVDGGSVVVRPTPRDLIPVYSRAAAWPALANVFGG